MIRFTNGNLLDASADALVNTVNEVGVMGKGIALMFKERFPANTRAYETASKAKQVAIGRMFVTETGELFPRWIINFPTKKHWRHPSKVEWISEGLDDLVRVIRDLGIRSIALPPLGCGNGGLSWATIRPLIESALSALADVEVLVYEPTTRYQNTPKREGVEALTAARALIAELVRRYAVVGMECTILEVQKLAYFLQRSISNSAAGHDPLKLCFSAGPFGPYSDQLRHLLDHLDGSYLHADKRLSDAGPLDLIWFDGAKRDVVASYLRGDEAFPFVPALEETDALIDGFESPLGLELLATVDWLLENTTSEPTVASIRAAIAAWPAGEESARRKLALFDDRLIELALDRLAVVA